MAEFAGINLGPRQSLESVMNKPSENATDPTINELISEARPDDTVPASEIASNILEPVNDQRKDRKKKPVKAKQKALPKTIAREKRDHHNGKAHDRSERLQIPTEQALHHVREWARSYFQFIYDNRKLPPSSSISRDNDVQHNIARLLNEEEAFLERRLTPLLLSGAREFLDELINFSQEISAESQDQDLSRTFAAKIRDVIFGFHPNIATYLSIPDQLLLTAKATRLTQVRGWFGPTLVGELGYALHFSKQDVPVDALGNLQQQPEVVLDIIDQLQIVAVDSFVSYSDGTDGFDRAKKIILDLQNKYKHPFIQMYATLAIARIDQESDDPSISIFQREGDPLRGRIAQEIAGENSANYRRLRNQISPSEPTPYEHKFFPISNDALGLFDRSNLLQSIAQADLSRLPAEQPVSMIDIRHFKDALDDPEYMQRLKSCENMVKHIHERVVLKLHTPNVDAVAVWKNISSVLSEKEWGAFFAGDTQLKDPQQAWDDFLEQSHLRSVSLSEQASDLFMQKLLVIEPEDLVTLKTGPQKYAKGLLLQFKEAYQKGELESAFNYANNLAVGIQLLIEENEIPTPPQKLVSVSTSFAELEQQRTAIWKQAEAERAQFAATLKAQALSHLTQIDYFSVIDKLKRNWQQLSADLSAYLNNFEQNNGANYLSVKFLSIDRIVQNPDQNPFSTTTQGDNNTVLLLQHLHRPDMRKALDDKLGFPVSHLGIRAQIAFLQYLSESEPYQFDHFCQFLDAQDADDRVAIATAFLAFQNQPEFNYIIERICQHKGVGIPIIRQLYRLIGDTNTLREFMEQEYTKSANRNLIPQIHDALIKKVYAVLLKYNAKVAELETLQELDYGHLLMQDYASDFEDEYDESALNATDNPTIEPRIQQASSLYDEQLAMVTRETETDLASMSASQQIFLHTFKALKKSGVDIVLEDFQNTSFSSIHGSELPAEETSHMRSLYESSMQGYPEATKKELLTDFDRHITDPHSMFSLLRYKGVIAGFLCFTEIEPGQKYVSAVTLDPRFQKAYIGETMIDEAFAREAEHNILGADCVAGKSVSARYIENGFIGVHSWDDKGDLIMDIVRDDRRNDRYFATKKLTQADIIRLAPLGTIGTATVDILDDPKHHDFARCNAGFVLTRYFKDDKTGKWYLVYEPRPSTESLRTPQVEEEKEKSEA